MGRNSKQRRDAKRKQAGRGPTQPRFSGGSRPTFGNDPFSGLEGDELFDSTFEDGFTEEPANPFGFGQSAPRDPDERLAELIRAGLNAGGGRSRNSNVFDVVIGQLVREARSFPDSFIDDTLWNSLTSTTATAFARGWQPAELVHALGRQAAPAETPLLVAVIGAHAMAHKAFGLAPQIWTDQLRELGLTPAAPAGKAAWRRWLHTEGLDRDGLWEPAMRLLSALGFVGSLPQLCPPPSEWAAVRQAPQPRVSNPKVLHRIRGLLAKAEASEFAEEAETLSAKAQDLMTRYAIESAMVDQHDEVNLTDQVQTLRLLIDNPYPETKVSLLQSVATRNGAQALWHKDFGLASVVGMPVDLELIEMLYTSLLIQGTHALREAGTDRRSRTPSFRRSFLLAYAHRIGERLEAARDRASRAASTQYGKELVPVLRERGEAVGSVFNEQFPRRTEAAPSVTNRSGWAAGRSAAERADITGGRARITG